MVSYIIKNCYFGKYNFILDGGSKNIFQSFDLQTGSNPIEFPVPLRTLKFPLVPHPNTCSGDSSTQGPSCFLFVYFFCIKDKKSGASEHVVH